MQQTDVATMVDILTSRKL